MEEKNNNNMEAGKKAAFQVGLAVFVLLAALTIGEFFLGLIASSWWAPLMGIALLKAFFIVREYMHLPRLFAPEEESHS